MALPLRRTTKRTVNKRQSEGSGPQPIRIKRNSENRGRGMSAPPLHQSHGTGQIATNFSVIHSIWF